MAVARALEGCSQVWACDRGALDLADPEAIRHGIREHAPDVIVNAGAYTAVDRAESEPERARAVNAIAPGILAEEAGRARALLVHFSTDYVFDGTKRTPYVETDPTHPLNVYGETKLEGERSIAAAGCDHLILRTSWVYAERGSNFMLTMLRLAATQPELRVVEDQRGAPTSSRQLAAALVALLVGAERSRAIEPADVDRLRCAGGLYHATAAGETSWFEFAQAIFEERARRPGPAFSIPRLHAIATSEYPRPARRPAYSVLSNEKLDTTFGIRIPDWRAGLREALSAVD
jgi:dTDP-4-dehydrorhamnose reductase